ncbi:dipeptidyl-peptidase-3 [Balneicella halophila]|uniref:Dipeptidyl-peptidase-3 n=1 Tax=Balneicella halophila TaxID=1537566 RepID=A0A7L4UR25_BALHA|nr:dihydrofolate reductase [Balneicella halophila]PVX52216.1 dipeptidyl-peptidase-3 [Balneicella halophila]
MKILKSMSLLLIGVAMATASCDKKAEDQPQDQQDFEWLAEKFADLKIIRYQIPQWNKLSLKQKELVYYLTEAAYSGREIIYQQNYRYGLEIKRALENIYTTYEGDKSTEDWKNFQTYVKRMWFSSGIFHHYANVKFEPKFSKEYLTQLVEETNTEISDDAFDAIFDRSDAKKVSLDANKDLLLSSAVNFYGTDVTAEEAEQFYAEQKKNEKDHDRPNELGLNTRLVKENGELKEQVYKVGGLYSEAIEEIVYWLEKAVTVAENEKQAKALRILIEYFQTGDLDKWTEYNIAWAEATDGDVDHILGFVEVYNDPMGYKGSFESIVQIKDFDMTEKMKVVAENAQYFEDNSPIMDEHKKENVVGVSYKVVNVAGEAGDASPSTPIGVNLPNNNWIRAEHGSKSVSLGNIVYAYSQAGGESILKEFAYDNDEIERSKKYEGVSDKMHTALHEVIGHASGKLNPGVGTPKETLKNYASTLEEARADLVALYYMPDTILLNLGLFENEEAAKAQYDGYLRNGLISQLIRIELGHDIEEAHMRNRQLVSKWVLEKGSKDKVVELVKKDDKTYVKINDYAKLRTLFGELLREIQRVKSEGDYEAGRALVENYGVKVDQELHKEVLARVEKLNIAPYGGFINPRLEAVMDADTVSDVKVHYDETFEEQMLRYSKEYSFLPTK